MYAIEVKNLNKFYDNGCKALDNINISINEGEIFALLGPNGAGKSTLINIICGITKKSNGKVNIFGHDNQIDYKKTRSFIGLVPQEIATDSFERVINTLKFSRGLFNKPRSMNHLNFVLESLDLSQKKNNQIRTMSGGMKRRVMIAKALSHEPKVLFLDEPTAGVDVSLRKNLWKYINKLKRMGVTIFLTTHYIEEAENIADRIGVINNGKIVIVERKNKLIKKFGKKLLTMNVEGRQDNIKIIEKKYDLVVQGKKISMTWDFNKKNDLVSTLLNDLLKNSIKFSNIEIKRSSLEEIFVDLVNK